MKPVFYFTLSQSVMQLDPYNHALLIDYYINLIKKRSRYLNSKMLNLESLWNSTEFW
jgi:hypothetical protein